MNDHLHNQLARAHIEELLRQAELPRLVAHPPEWRAWLPATLVRAVVGRLHGSTHSRPELELLGGRPVTIRYACADDDAVFERLAALDSAAIPPPPILVAEVDGEPRVALSLGSSEVVADPFHKTAPLVELVRVRAAQLTATARRGGSARRRHRAGRRALDTPMH
jgi:hypothetical protein